MGPGRVGQVRVLGAVLLLVAACGDDDVPAVDGGDSPDADAFDAGPDPVEDEEPPEVTSTRPRDGEELVARGAELSIRFSEAVDEGSGTVTATGAGETLTLGAREWLPDGDVLLLRPESGQWPGGARVDVRIEGFVDLAGNAQVGAHEIVFHTSDDGAPTVVDASPAEGAGDVDPTLDVIALEFSEPMNPVLGELALEGGPGELGERAWSTDRELRVAVRGLEAGTDYRVVLGGFEDRSGNPLDGEPVLDDGALDFATVPDTTAPTVVDSNPSHGQLDVDVGLLRSIEVTFSEPMDTAVRSAVLTDGSSIATLTGNWSLDATSIRFDAAGRVTVDAENRLDLSGMRDRAGNALDGTVGLDEGELVFTTSSADETIPFVVFSTPVEGAADVSTRTEALSILFSEAMDVARAGVDLVSAAESLALEGAWNAAGTRLDLPLDGLAARTGYEIDLTGFTDASGNALDATHPYLGDGVLDFATGSPTGESCTDPLTVGEATSDGSAHEWELVAGQFTTDDGPPSCSPNAQILDGVIAYEKTTGDLSSGGRALRITATSADAFNGVQLEVFRDVCDPEAVGGGAAAREACLSARTQWVQYLDVPAGTYYVWVGNEYGRSCSYYGCTYSPFAGATVRIEEVDVLPEGESCHDPFDASSAIYASPAADEHVFVVPHGVASSMDYGTSSNGEGGIPCYARQGPDAVLRVDKARAESILDVEVDPFPAETFGSAWSLDRAGVVLDVLDACDAHDPATASLACPGRLNTPRRFQVGGDTGDYYLWLAANNSEVEIVRTTVRVREVDPQLGETCGNAIPLTPGTGLSVSPGSAEAYFAPSCVSTAEGVTWYRFTASRELTVVSIEGAGELALVDAASGDELGCIADGTLGMPYRAPAGRELCIAVPSGSGVTGLSIRELDWQGVDGTPTDLGIGRPLSDTGTELSITSEVFLEVTPTQLYMGLSPNSSSAAALVTAPRAGGATAERLLVDRYTLGNAAVSVGEALFSVEETNRSERLFRLVDSTGSLGATPWDTGSVYETPDIDAMGEVAGTDTVVLANDGTTSIPTTFYTASTSAPGAVTRLGQNAFLRDVVAVAGDGTWLYVIGSVGPTTATVRTVYRLPASDVTAEPEPLVPSSLVSFSTLNGSMVLDASRDILYFRSTRVPRGVHAVFGASTADPVYVGPVFVRGGSSDYGLALDESVPALFLFETETVSTGTFIELR